MSSISTVTLVRTNKSFQWTGGLPAFFNHTTTSGWVIAVAGQAGLVLEYDWKKEIGWAPLANLDIVLTTDEPLEGGLRVNRMTSIVRSPPNKILAMPSWQVWKMGGLEEAQAGLMREEPAVPGLHQILVVGAPPPYMVDAMIGRLADANIRAQVIVVGRTFTRDLYGPLSALGTRPDIDYKFVEMSVQSFGRWPNGAISLIDCSRLAAVMIGLSGVSTQFSYLIGGWSHNFSKGAEVCFFGPAFGSLSARALDSAELARTRSIIMPEARRTRRYAATRPNWTCVIDDDVEQTMAVEPPHICTPVSSSIDILVHERNVIAGFPFLDPALEASQRAEWAAEAVKLIGPPPKSGTHSASLNCLGPDWTSRHESNWRSWWGQAATGTNLDVLVIGAFEGVSVNMWEFLRQGQPGTTYVCDVGPSEQSAWGVPRMWFLRDNLPASAEMITGPSALTLPNLLARLEGLGSRVAAVEIDGSHNADDVFLDAEYGFRMLEVGGIMLFDDIDYSGVDPQDTTLAMMGTTPRRGYNAFLHLHAGDLKEAQTPHPSTQRCWIKVRESTGISVEGAYKTFAQIHHSLEVSGSAVRDYPLPLSLGDVILGLTARNPTDRAVQRNLETLVMQIISDASVMRQLKAVLSQYVTIFAGDVYVTAPEHPNVFDSAVAANLAAAIYNTDLLLDGSGHVARSFGRAWEATGEWIGHGHEHDAIAGLGNAFKSIGVAPAWIGDGLSWVGSLLGTRK